jgi:hypothetical protein
MPAGYTEDPRRRYGANLQDPRYAALGEGWVWPVVAKRKTAAQTHSVNTTYVDDLHLVFPIVATAEYIFDGLLLCSGAATTTGPRFSFIARDGAGATITPTYFRAASMTTPTATTAAGAGISAFDGPLLHTGTLATADTTPTPVMFGGHLITPTAGRFWLRLSTEINASAANYARGSWMRLQRVA